MDNTHLYVTLITSRLSSRHYPHCHHNLQVSLAGGNVLTVQGKGFPADDPSATTVNVVIYDHRFGSNTKLTIPCSVLSVAVNGRSLQCVLSRPDYQHTPYFNILLYGVPSASNDDATASRRLLAAETAADTSVEDRGEGRGIRAAAVTTSTGVKVMTDNDPTGQPSTQPSVQPSAQPSRQPTNAPSRLHVSFAHNMTGQVMRRC